MSASKARQHQAELAERCEARRSGDVALVIAAAEARGERVDPVTVATGRVQGRSVADVLQAAQQAADRQDQQAEADARRQRGERLGSHFVGELEDPATRPQPVMAGTRRAIEQRDEAFRASVSAQREAERASGRAGTQGARDTGAALGDWPAEATVTTPADPEDFADLCGSLPDHATEVVTRHLGKPTPQEQAPKRPAVDAGYSNDQAKYSTGGL